MRLWRCPLSYLSWHGNEYDKPDHEDARADTRGPARRGGKVRFGVLSTAITIRCVRRDRWRTLTISPVPRILSSPAGGRTTTASRFAHGAGTPRQAGLPS